MGVDPETVNILTHLDDFRPARKMLKSVDNIFDPCVSKQCPADGVWRIGGGGSPDRVLKTRFNPSESSAGHGLPPQRAPKQCPANGVRRLL